MDDLIRMGRYASESAICLWLCVCVCYVCVPIRVCIHLMKKTNLSKYDVKSFPFVFA